MTARILLLALILPAVAKAQPGRSWHDARVVESAEGLSMEGPFTLCVLHASELAELDEAAAFRQRAARRASTAKASATFEVTYDGFTDEARTAFQAAVDIWSTHVTSEIPIRINAVYADLGPTILGSAGANRIHAGGGLPIARVWYGDALADALRNRDSNPGQPDINAQFSSGFPAFYYGTDGNPGPDEVDFMTVVLHEIGHGLGFFGSASVTGSTGMWGVGSQGYPVVFDRGAEDGGGVAVTNTSVFPNPSVALGDVLQGGSLFFDDAGVRSQNGALPAPLYAPAVWDDGSSFSHWDETTFVGDANALMTPFIARGEAYDSPGALTCALLEDIGWTLGDGCRRAVSSEPAALASGAAPELELAGPNPFASSTTLRLRLAEPQPVRATLHDALGRTVAVLHDGPVAAGALSLRIEGELAPGVYVVRAETETGSAQARIVRAGSGR